MTTSPPIPRPASVLIVRLSAMGDIIHTLPAAAALRQAFPDATLGWLVEGRWTELLCAPGYPRSGPRSSQRSAQRSPQRPLVDRIHTVTTKEWRRAPFSINTWRAIAASLRELRNLDYDAVVDFQGAIRSAVLSYWSGAPVIFGSAHPRESEARILYTHKIQPTGAHVVEQAMALSAAVVGKPLPIPQVEFPVDPDAERKIAGLVADGEAIAILNPGAGWGAKRWPAERYGQVASELAKEGIRSLVNYGPGEEDLAAAVENASAGAARKVSCSISELIALTRRARLFVGGDTGPLHMAAALNVPVVAIFGPTDPARNGPFGTRSIVLRNASSITDHSRHREPEQGLLEITAEEVVAAARNLLRNQIAESQIAESKISE
jgi:heptosyltransferase-1